MPFIVLSGKYNQIRSFASLEPIAIVGFHDECFVILYRDVLFVIPASPSLLVSSGHIVFPSIIPSASDLNSHFNHHAIEASSSAEPLIFLICCCPLSALLVLKGIYLTHQSFSGG